MARVIAEQKSSDHRYKSLSLFVTFVVLWKKIWWRSWGFGVDEVERTVKKQINLITELLPVDEECEFIY